MELCSLNSLQFSSISRIGLLQKPFLRGRTINLPPYTKKKYADARKLKVLDCRAQASVGSEVSGVKASKNVDSKDSNLIFVAGATGKVGSRTVRELLKLGFRVRAGVRSRQRAESLLQSIQQMKLDDIAKPIENLEIVECDLEKSDRIVPALANSSVVICCIGASEKEVFDITGPYRIDYLATKNLIDAATFAKVNHFILLTSLGTNKVGFPAAILNLFWGVLIWKRRAEEALLASGLPYTIVRPGGMERPTDSYKETHNVTLSEEDTLFGGQVSNLQVAELLAFMAKNQRLSYCKVVEVIAETTAPLTPPGDLLAKISSQRKLSYADGPEPAVKESETSESSSAPSVEEPPLINPTSERPLSPYTASEDLKPPTTPSPTPRSSTGGSKASNKTVEINSSAASSTVAEIEAPTEEKKTNSSSPYPNYDDLKPPVSPTPNPPSSREDTSISEAASISAAADSETSIITNTEADPSESTPQITRPLSPYTAYEDLKPPSSASPIPSGPKEATNGALTSLDTGDNDIAKAGTTSPVEKDPPPSSASRLSPYIVYEDLKPPSSPSPNAPVISGNGKPVPPLVDTSTIKQEDSTIKQQPLSSAIQQEDSTIKQQPLSPFTMYEDLKPPSSPAPSLKKL